LYAPCVIQAFRILIQSIRTHGRFLAARPIAVEAWTAISPADRRKPCTSGVVMFMITLTSPP